MGTEASGAASAPWCVERGLEKQDKETRRLGDNQRLGSTWFVRHYDFVIRQFPGNTCPISLHDVSSRRK